MNDNRSHCVALLIDADNLSADVIEQALEHLFKQHGAIQFRRAYCSPQKMTEHMDLFRRHSIRPMINVPTGKNSTDIALAVDAIDLAFTEQPDVVVIASSDSDYAPLAIRLRERGCRVLGIGQAGKTGAESPLAYDEFVEFAHRKAGPSSSAPAAKAPRASARAGARATPTRSARDGDESMTRDPDERAARDADERPTRAPPPARIVPPPPPPPRPDPLPDEVARILQAVPMLNTAVDVQLNEVGEQLRKHGLLKSKSASPSRFLKRWADYFELMPADKPRTVAYRGPSGR